MERPLSECCKAPIYDSLYGGSDLCSGCDKSVHYATGWRGDTAAVFQKHDGTLWFFGCQTSNWVNVMPNLYIGQVKEVVDSVTARYQRDEDRISQSAFDAFAREYKGKVQNPQGGLAPLAVPEADGLSKVILVIGERVDPHGTFALTLLGPP